MPRGRSEMENGACFGKTGKANLKHPLQSPLLWFWNKEMFFLFYIVMQVHSTMSPGPYLNTRMTPTTFSINNNCMDRWPWEQCSKVKKSHPLLSQNAKHGKNSVLTVKRVPLCRWILPKTQVLVLPWCPAVAAERSGSTAPPAESPRAAGLCTHITVQGSSAGRRKRTRSHSSGELIA